MVKLSLEEWRRLAEEGTKIPITTSLTSLSMEPLIRVYKDPVTFVPIERKPVPGDVVLFKRMDGAYVCHRVYKTLDDGNTVMTWGDNAEHPDAPIPRSSVFGLAVSYERDGKQYILDCDEQREKGLKWLSSKWERPVFVRYRKLRQKIGDVKRSVFPDRS